MNATRRDSVPLLFAATASLLIAACSDRSNESSQDVTPAEPLVTAPREDTQQDLRISTNAGGIASRYAPQFEGSALVRIDEQRETEEGKAAPGAYVFQGARLMRYEGDALDGAGRLLLVFDLQGRVITARLGESAASDEQISAIRTRAQLLRNHALAQHASRTHAQ
jgi:hypothetical protein